MRDACVSAVERVLGRDLTVAEGRNIESRIKAAMRVRAGKDAAAWRAMSEPQRLVEAAQMAAKQFVFDAKKKKDRTIQTALHSAKIDNYTSDQVNNGIDKNRLEALHRMLRPKNDMKNNVNSVESMANGYEWAGVRKMLDVFGALRPGLKKHIPWERKDRTGSRRRAEWAQSKRLAGDRRCGERVPCDGRGTSRSLQRGGWRDRQSR